MATFLFDGAAVLLFGMALSALFHLRWSKRLPSLAALGSESLAQSSDLARVSIVIPARDEETRIEGTVCHALAQRGADIEVIVVDDRSTDRTPEILRRLVKIDSRLRVKRVDTLPEGWLGKCHACHVGASAATGDWILFMDADCWLKPDVVARALRVAEREKADHITLGPDVPEHTLAAQAWHLAFLVTASGWISGVNRDRPWAHLGIGAFNLVRASAYRNCGGYEALRLSVVDDMKLGLLLRRAGKRTRAFIGPGDVECHWGTTMRDLVRLVEKNGFAALEYRLSVTVIVTLLGAIMMGAAFIGPFTRTIPGMAAGLGGLSLIVPGIGFARRLGWSWQSGVLMPFTYPVLLYAMFKSTWLTLRQGGIRWRDTFYPLRTLRANNVRW